MSDRDDDYPLPPEAAIRDVLGTGDAIPDDGTTAEATLTGDRTDLDRAPDETVESGARLLAIELDDPLKAQEMLLAMMRLFKKGSFSLEDAAIVTKDRGGKIKIQQTKDLNTSQGAIGGAWLGTLAGLLVMMPLVGAALGAAIGGIWAKLRDIGIDDDEMRRMGETLREGDSALFLLMDDVYITHLTIELRRFDGEILATTFSEPERSAIAEALRRPLA